MRNENDIIVLETHYNPPPLPSLRDRHRRLYAITNIQTGEDGQPFALCGYHFDRWDAKDKVVWRIIGENTSEPCNHCQGD